MTKFFICELCGNLVDLIDNKGTPMSCCGQKMTALVPNTVEASTEKHLPDATVSGDDMTVQVGSVTHPMGAEHYIAFVYVETANGSQRKDLKIDAVPSCKFTFADDKPVAVYAYCNLHGMWKTEL